MATTSQKIMEIRFFVRILGALTPAPRIDEPVMKIPLSVGQNPVWEEELPVVCSYHAAPTTERPMQRVMPRSAHAYGEIDSRKAPI